MLLAAGGAAAVEALREELALAKEQARASNAAALKAAEDLRAEQAACRCQNRRISGRGSRTVRLGGW